MVWVSCTRSCSVLLACAIGITPGVARAEGKSIPPEEFLAQYRRILQQLEGTYGDGVRIEGRVRLERHMEPPAGKSWPVQVTKRSITDSPWHPFVYSSSGGNSMVGSSGRTGDAYHEGAEIKEGEHTFMVKRTAPDGLYSLVDSDKKDNDSRTPSESPERLKRAPYCPWSRLDFPAYVRSQDFKISEVIRTEEADKATVKVSFNFKPTEKTQPSLEGFLRLDPNANWVLTDFEIDATSPPSAKYRIVSKETGTTRYRQENGHALPVEVHYKNVGRSSVGDKFEEMEYQIDRFELGLIPAEEFTLAHYGLGDFEAPAPRSVNHLGYYAMALAVAAGLISFVLARLARDKRGQAASPAPPANPEVLA